MVELFAGHFGFTHIFARFSLQKIHQKGAHHVRN